MSKQYNRHQLARDDCNSLSDLQLVDIDWQNQFDQIQTYHLPYRNHTNYQLIQNQLIQCQPLFHPSTKTHLRTHTDQLTAHHSRHQTELHHPNNDDSLNLHRQHKQHKDISHKLLTPQLQCTFQPSILKKSTQIAQKLIPSFERLTQHAKPPSKQPYQAQKPIKKFSESRISQLSKPRKQKNHQQQEILPSFKPSISKKSLYLFETELDIANRNKIWYEQKEAKIRKLRQEEQQLKLKNQSCTYAPKIKHYKGQSEVILSNFTKEGIANYFERLNIKNKQIPNKQKKQQYFGKENLKGNFYVSNKPKNISKNNQIKKTNYQRAVNELHQKIMKLKL